MTGVQRPDRRDALQSVPLSAPLVDGAGAVLPVSLTPLIDRDQEVAAVAALLGDPEVRLLTLTGPGGVGKTRLAIAAATEVDAAFPDGVAFINLAPIANPDLVQATIAGAVGLRDMGSASLPDRLIGVLAERTLLLVLDNFEQVVTAGPQVRDLLAACPGVTLLVTSRIRLRLSGEREFPVSPLPLPHLSTVEDAGICGAVRLFIERAQAFNPDFQLTAETMPAITEIVRRLDGLPLAIELAAARMKVLPPAALLERLEQRLPLLSGGARDLPLRQQTMRDTIGWSYDLLDDAEQALFRRLSVFVGGFSLQAAEALGAGAADASGRLAPHDALDGVTALVEQNLLLLMPGPRDEPRYRMLETVREFGLEQLAASGEENSVRAAHAAHVSALAAKVSEQVFAPGYNIVLARLDADLDNIRAALQWADASGEGETVLRLATALGPFWNLRGHFHEGRSWLERGLARTDPGPSALRAAALIRTGALANLQGDIDAAEPLLTGGARVARVVGAQWTEALASMGLGMVALQRGDLSLAAERAEEAWQQFRILEDAHAVGRQFLSLAYANRGQIALVQGDLAAAGAFLQEAMERQRAMEFSWGLADTLRILGDLARAQGDSRRALTHYQESLDLVREHGDKRLLAEALSGLASVVATTTGAEPAAKLLGAAEALRQQIGTSIKAWDRPAYERGVDAVRSGLSPEMFAAAFAAGQSMPHAGVIAEALADQRSPALPRVPVSASDSPVASLTPRERDVLRLLAEGLSDREISARLAISERTAGNHVLHILQKLDVDSRTAAAVFAIRHGLD